MLYVVHMYIFLRYTLVFLISLNFLSVQGASYHYLHDVSSVQLWGNHSDVIIEEGKGRIEIESTVGGSFLFVSPSGTCISFCTGDCTIRLFVPKKNRVSLWFDEAKVSVDGISYFQSEIRTGSVYSKDVLHSTVSIYQGEIDAIVPPNGTLNVRGERLEGQIFSYGDGWKHKVYHSGSMFEENSNGVSQSVVQVQFLQGHLELFTDTFVLGIPSEFRK